MCASRSRWLRPLRNFQLGASQPPLTSQPEILAARTVPGPRRRRPLLRRQNALGQRPRFRQVRRHDRAGNHPTRTNRASHSRASPRRRILPGPPPARRHRLRPHRMPTTPRPPQTALSARFAKIRRQIDSLRAQGLLDLEGNRLRLSPKHLTISSSILAELLT